MGLFLVGLIGVVVAVLGANFYLYHISAKDLSGALERIRSGSRIAGGEGDAGGESGGETGGEAPVSGEQPAAPGPPTALTRAKPQRAQRRARGF